MSKEKLLILNGGHSETPLILAAKKLGFHVITTGNIPTLIGHQYADEYYPADFSDKHEILKLSQKLGIDAVCSSANDFGTITAAYISEQIGLAGHDTYETSLLIHHKDRFKEFAIKNKIQTPFAESYDDRVVAKSAINKYQYPVIVKPIDLTGGKGITKVTDSADYCKAIDKAFDISREKRIVVEEFFEGSQHSFSTFIINQKVAFCFSDNEYSYLNPYLVSTSAAPAVNIHKFEDKLIQSAEKTASLLKLTDGILHMQYLARENRFTIIEMTRRCSGDLYPYPVEYSSSIDWAAWIVKAEAGQSCTNFPKKEQTGYCGRHCIMSNRNGVIDDVIINDGLKANIYQDLMWWKPGDIVKDYMTEKLGILLLRYSSMEEMIEKTADITNLVRVSIKD